MARCNTSCSVKIYANPPLTFADYSDLLSTGKPLTLAPRLQTLN